MSLAARLQEVREHIASAARRAGRDPSEVRLVAVSKLRPAAAVLEASELGVTDFGENMVQELVRKAEQVHAAGREVRWHFVGKLQSNKVNHLLRVHPWLVQSIDRLDLARALSSRAGPEGLDVLLQVNIGREPQKGGVAPEHTAELARQVAALPGLRVKGLMCIPPVDRPPRPFFEEMARLSHEVRQQAGCAEARELSMGMTSDYEDAIACGATMVRIGTAIFGEREAREERPG